MKIKDGIAQWKKEGAVPINPQGTWFIHHIDDDESPKPPASSQQENSPNESKPKKGVQIIIGPDGEEIEIAAKGIVGAFSLYDNETKITGLYLVSVDGLSAIDEFVINCDNDKETLMIYKSEEEAKKEYEKYEEKLNRLEKKG